MPSSPLVRYDNAAHRGTVMSSIPRRFFLFVLMGITVALFVRSDIANSPTASSTYLARGVTEVDLSVAARLKATTEERDLLARQVKELQQKYQQAMNATLRTAIDSERPKPNDEEGAFPYRLTCPGDPLPASVGSDYTITLAYHVGMIKNWKTIVHDQMNTLRECGLGAAASDFILSYSAGSLDSLQEVVRPYGFFVADSEAETSTSGVTSTPNRTTTIVNSTKSPWEGAMMNSILEYCVAQHTANPDRPTIVFYFHNKGSSKYQPNWQTGNGQYQKVLYWRKYMEYYLHERPNLCLNELLYRRPGQTRPGMCGIMWHGNHYSGNFWSANCQYIATALKPMNMTAKLNYVAGEMWIGGGKDAQKDFHRPVSLHENPSGIGLYKHAVDPHEYSDYHERWKSRLNPEKAGRRY